MNEEIEKELKKKLEPANVKKNPKGFDYVEGWFAIQEANRIFGFGGWTRETIELIENTPATKNAKGNNVVSFRAKVRVTAHGVVREGIGFGSGISKDIHDAYEGAIKEAETDAMKRALMTFGNPFGLALYDKQKENVGENLTPEQEKQQAEAQEKIEAMKAKADNIRQQLKDSENLEVLEYVWKGFKKDLDTIKACSEPAYKTLEKVKTNMATALAQAPAQQAAE